MQPPETIVQRRHRVRLFQIVYSLNLRPALAAYQKWRLGAAGGFAPGQELLTRHRDRELVFVVSFHKCGTRSLHLLFETLGLRGMHYPNFPNSGFDFEYLARDYTENREAFVRLLAPLFGRYDTFSDVPFSGLYRELAAAFPRAKFVLTHREPDAWWDSIVSHWGLEWRPWYLTPLEAVQYRLPCTLEITTASRELLIERYLAHRQDVEDCFRGTGRLFTAPLTSPDVAANVARFVGKAYAGPLPQKRQGSVYE